MGSVEKVNNIGGRKEKNGIQTTCPGCSCLCDDVMVIERNGETKVLNACRRGASIFLNKDKGRAKPTINGNETDIDSAMEKAVEIIAGSKSLAIYGLDTITSESQNLAIELAEKTEAFIDDNSSYCLGDFVEMCLNGTLPTTTLDSIRDNAYVIIYWGSNPFHSLPRHMSRYSYFPRGKNRQRGYEEDRFLVVIDVRTNNTSKLVKRNGLFLEIESDIELISEINDFLEEKVVEHTDEIAKAIREIKKGDTVIFGGLGLKYGLRQSKNGDKDYREFVKLVKKLNGISNVYFMPAGFHPNMRGFNEALFKKTGHINKYSFREKTSQNNYEFSYLLNKNKIDTALIIGSDPVNSLPFEISKELNRINSIVIDPRQNFTSLISEVVIPSAISGVETGGTMVRSDGLKFELKNVIENRGYFGDEYILKQLLKSV